MGLLDRFKKNKEEKKDVQDMDDLIEKLRDPKNRDVIIQAALKAELEMEERFK